MDRPPTARERDYLKELYLLGAADRPVTPTEAAARLGVGPPAVLSTFKRLACAGWARHELGIGARLTEAGLAEARRVVRRHQLAEALLGRVLGFASHEAGAEAATLQRAISQRVEQAIAAYLSEPDEAPQGPPSPSP